MLSPIEDKEIELLCEKLRDLDSLTKSLRSNSMTCHKVRILFDSTIDLFPSTLSRRAPNASITSHPFLNLL